MTLREAKDQVAKDCGFEDWEHIFSSYNLQKIEQITDEAAELYARSKWNEACEEQITFCSVSYQNACFDPLNRSEKELIETSPKPEFKP